MSPPFRCLSIGLLVAAPLAAGLAATRSMALPLFSRELSVSCAHCHTAAPRLNPTGMEFMQRGYRAA